MLSLEIGADDIPLCSTYHSIPEDQRQMAITARFEFKQENYPLCLQTLRRLQAVRPQDMKVFHNICVAEYYLSKCRDTSTFYNNLLTICKQAHIEDDFDLIDDVDQCVVFYNRAVILFHLHKYEAAIEILDKVFQFVEPLGIMKLHCGSHTIGRKIVTHNRAISFEEILSLKICFLLMELYLCTNQAKKALGVGAYVESTILSGTSKGNNYGKMAKEIPDSVKAKLVQYKARCYTMMKTFKSCKREVKALMASDVQDQQVAGLFIKSQLEYFRNNHKKALRIINSAQYSKNTSEHFYETGDLLKAMHWNNVACIHYHFNKSSLGAHYLHSAIQMFHAEQAILQDTEKAKDGSTDCHDVKLNPVMVVFYNEERSDPVLLSIVESTDNTGKDYPSNMPIHTLRGEMMYRLVFNLGMMNFKSKRYAEAFQAFVKATGLYNGDPQLWLRIAECCIRLHEIKQGNVGLTNEMTIVKQYIGASIYKKAILKPSLETLSFSLVTRTSPVVAPTLNYALHALKTAWHFLPNETSSDISKNSSAVAQPSSEKEGNHTQDHSCLPITHSHIGQGDEIQKIRNFILLNSSYISLRSGDVGAAYSYAMKLLSQRKVSSIQRYLAHSYAAEALVSLDRISDAVDHLNPEQMIDASLKSSEDFSTKQSKSDFSLSSAKADWFPSIADAKAISQYNLAVVHTIRGEWARASHLLSRISPESSAPVKDLMVYINLCQGATDVAKNSIKQRHPGTAK